MTTNARIAALALAAVVGGIGSQITDTSAPVCDQLAHWPAMVDTHGVDDAGNAWNALVDDGWTNPRSGDVLTLVQPGCADAWA